MVLISEFLLRNIFLTTITIPLSPGGPAVSSRRCLWGDFLRLNDDPSVTWGISISVFTSTLWWWCRWWWWSQLQWVLCRWLLSGQVADYWTINYLFVILINSFVCWIVWVVHCSQQHNTRPGRKIILVFFNRFRSSSIRIPHGSHNWAMLASVHLAVRRSSKELPGAEPPMILQFLQVFASLAPLFCSFFCHISTLFASLCIFFDTTCFFLWFPLLALLAPASYSVSVCVGRRSLGSWSHNTHANTITTSKTDEFSEKFKTAFDPPPSFSENHIAIFLKSPLKALYRGPNLPFELFRKFIRFGTVTRPFWWTLVWML